MKQIVQNSISDIEEELNLNLLNNNRKEFNNLKFKEKVIYNDVNLDN